MNSKLYSLNSKLYAIIALLSCVSCANRGIGPQGGPKDSLPPVIVKATPENGTLDFKENKIELQFNEYIVLDNPADNVLVSPPQQHPADIRAIGKKIRVEFKEPLRDSTTYTIDFGNAIQDNNEKNPLKDYTFAFTTDGPIDSLEIYGQIINAEDLNPISGITIGIQANLDDSAFSTIPFDRIGRSDEEGEFYIRNIHPGTYRLYALKDVSKDYIYQPGEGLAFQEATITPHIDIRIETDTIWRTDTIGIDSTLIPDSVITAQYYYFEPSDLVLKFFMEDKQRHYFQRALREQAHCFQLRFSAPQTTLPRLQALRLESDTLAQDSAWVNFLDYCFVQPSAHNDTITYWLTDSAAIRMDSIRFAMTYEWTDSLYNLVEKTDTVLAVYRAPQMTEKAKALMEKRRAEATLEVRSNASTRFHIYDTLRLISPTPLQACVADSLHLRQRVDTTWRDIPFTLVPKDECKMQYWLIASLKPEGEYKLHLDSAALVDIYGLACQRTDFAIKLRSKADYATLTIKVAECPENAIVQLVDDKDKVVRQAPGSLQGTKFEYLDAQVYYMRMFIDSDRNGRWTTGDWLHHRQPEEVFYSKKRLNLRANWEFEETFDWQSLPLLEQKPRALRKDASAKR